MNIADHLMAHKTAHALNGFTDDSGTEMAHVQGLCHIGSAVVHDHSLRMLRRLHSQLLSSPHPIHIIGQKAASDLQVNEARHNSGNLLEDLAVL